MGVQYYKILHNPSLMADDIDLDPTLCINPDSPGDSGGGTFDRYR
jgi:hypothetical protein